MIKKLLMIVATLLVATPSTFAQTKDYLVISHSEGEPEEIDLSTIQRIAFNAENTQMQVNLAGGKVRRIGINSTDSYSFRSEQVGPGPEDVFGKTFTVTPAEGEAYGPQEVGTVLCVHPEGVGTSTSFAFSELQVTTPAELRGSAHYAVAFTVSATKMGSEIDCADELSTYTFTLYDYTTGTYVTAAEGTTGKIITRQRENGDYAFRVDLTLQDGTKVQAEYEGAVVMTDDLEPMVPLPVLPNEYTYYEADNEKVWVHADITGLVVKESGDDLLLYFLDKVNTSVSKDAYAMPQIRVAKAFVNAGEVKLAEEVPGKWSISFKDINLQSHDNDWVNWPDNGIMKIACDEATGEYDIFITIINSYTNYMGSGKGNHMALTLSYKGKAN